jgi:predicted nucleic acid-binding Zn ribbon protein
MTDDERTPVHPRLELARDRRRERALVWKGAFALLVVVAMALARQYWWV